MINTTLYTDAFVSRFWAKVDKSGPIPAHCPDLGPCWVWTGRIEESGYGRVAAPRLPGRSSSTMLYTHRLSVELNSGPIGEGLQVDHRCRVRSCCNPQHLEPVTPKVNIERSTTAQASRDRCARVTHCPQGHEYTTENTFLRQDLYRTRKCRTCHRDRERARRAAARTKSE